MQLWYVCKENQLLGPFQEVDLKQGFEKKSFQAHDWVRKAEQVDWQLASSVEDLKSYFTATSQDKLPFEENWFDKWVLLQANPDTKAFSQSGPYSTKEILTKIYSGQAEYSDYVWQQGMTEWKRLGAVDAFIPKEEVEETPTAAKAPVVNRETIGGQVMTHQPVKNSYYEQLPLFEEENKFPITTKSQRIIKPVDKFPEYYKPVVNKRKRWWIFSFFCFVLSLAIAIWGKNSLSLYL
jgi:nitrogen fixation protein